MINAMAHAFKAIYLRSFVSIPSVICRNTGITPRGSIKVNSEVKHNVKYTNISMMTYSLLSIIISQKTYQIAFCNIKFCRISILNPYRQK